MSTLDGNQPTAMNRSALDTASMIEPKEEQDAVSEESLREILEAPVIADIVAFLRESLAQQADSTKRQADGALKLQKQQLELQAAESERQHELERHHIELAVTYSRWSRWLVTAALAGFAALFVGFRTSRR